jgi:hypothetical protein
LATESNGLGGDAKTFAFGAIGPSIFDGTVGVGVTPTSRNNTTLQIKDGIGFPATQVASSDANTLDDYEEGTFDFGIAFGGSSTGVTYTNRQGAYTKIGRQVTVSGQITLSSKGAQVGDATITGLPFTVGTGTQFQGGVCFGVISSITFADILTARLEGNTATCGIYETTNAGVLTALTNADFANSSQINFTATYFVS